MVMDTIGLLLCVTLMSAVRARPAAQRALPLAALAPLAAGDLWCIWHELKSIHLRSLNRERAEIAAEAWLRDGAVPSARQARPRPTLDRPRTGPKICMDCKARGRRDGMALLWGRLTRSCCSLARARPGPPVSTAARPGQPRGAAAAAEQRGRGRAAAAHRAAGGRGSRPGAAHAPPAAPQVRPRCVW